MLASFLNIMIRWKQVQKTSTRLHLMRQLIACSVSIKRSAHKSIISGVFVYLCYILYGYASITSSALFTCPPEKMLVLSNQTDQWNQMATFLLHVVFTLCSTEILFAWVNHSRISLIDLKFWKLVMNSKVNTVLLKYVEQRRITTKKLEENSF